MTDRSERVRGNVKQRRVTHCIHTTGTVVGVVSALLGKGSRTADNTDALTGQFLAD